MKRIVGAFLIGSVLFYLNFWGSRQICLVCENIDSQLEECAVKIKAKEYEEAKSISHVVLTSWQEKSDILSIVLGDTVLSAPSEDIFALYRCVGDESYLEALSFIRQCQGCLQNIIDSQSLSLGNIL